MKLVRILIVIAALSAVGVVLLRHSNLFERQYPLSVQFAAPHLGTVAKIMDRLWFTAPLPRYFHSIVSVVYAQSCPPQQFLKCIAVIPCGTCTDWECKLQNKLVVSCVNGYGSGNCADCGLCH